MTRTLSRRSGRPLVAAGPLASLLVGAMTLIGLGCTTAASPTGPPAAASATDAVRQSTDIAGPWALPDPQTRRPAETDAPPARRDPDIRRPAEGGATRELAALGAQDATPRIPVVAARPHPSGAAVGTRPVRVRIGAVDLDVRVVATGVAENGSMELPDTVHRAGWYRFSVPPGSRAGSTVIAAHVDTREEGLGPFARLAELRRGDQITLTDRSGDDHAYRVTTRRHITRSRLPAADLFDRGGRHRLILITCGGAYDSGNGYHDNVVVLAEPSP